MLQHFPDKLQAELKNHTMWEGIDDTRRVVSLLILTRTHNTTSWIENGASWQQSMVDFDVYLCVQRERTINKYYKIFTSTVETINTNGGNVELHLAVFKRHFTLIKDKGMENMG